MVRLRAAAHRVRRPFRVSATMILPISEQIGRYGDGAAGDGRPVSPSFKRCLQCRICFGRLGLDLHATLRNPMPFQIPHSARPGNATGYSRATPARPLTSQPKPAPCEAWEVKSGFLAVFRHGFAGGYCANVVRRVQFGLIELPIPLCPPQTT